MGATVSIIVPIFNLEDYVEKCIQSLLAQSYKNIELILVDDGSTDSSAEICRKYQQIDGRVKFISQSHQGVSSARNKGLDNASGQYVMFVDGDDFVSSRIIEELLVPFSNDEIIMSVGRGKPVRVREYTFTNKEEAPSELITSTEIIRRQLLGRPYAQGACVRLFRKDKIGDIRFVDGKAYNEDSYFSYLYNLTNHGKVFILHKRLYAYYMRKSSITHTVFNEKKLSIVEFATKKYEDCKNIPELGKYAHFNFISSRLTVIKDVIRSKQFKKEKELIKKLRKEILQTGLPKLPEIDKKKKAEVFFIKVGIKSYWLFVKFVDTFRKRK